MLTWLAVPHIRGGPCNGGLGEMAAPVHEIPRTSGLRIDRRQRIVSVMPGDAISRPVIPPLGDTAWVLCGDEDEDLRSILRPGRSHLWSDARLTGKEIGQFVLFLQTGRGPPAWIGSGAVAGIAERWKIFGVWVDCRVLLARPLVAIARSVPGTGDSSTTEVGSWENRTLATRIGLRGFRMRTPFLEGGCDLRLTSSDTELLLQLQPELRRLLHREVHGLRGASEASTDAP